MRRRELPLLLVACALLSGGTCVETPDPTPVTATAHFVFPGGTILSVGEIVQVQLVVDTDGMPVQAADASVRGDAATSTLLAASPDPAFDDNGTLFLSPVVDAANAEIRRIVDFRHGAPAAPGTIPIANVTLRADVAGQSTLRFSAIRVASSDGVDLVVTAVDQAFEVIP